MDIGYVPPVYELDGPEEDELDTETPGVNGAVKFAGNPALPPSVAEMFKKVMPQSLNQLANAMSDGDQVTFSKRSNPQ